MFSRKRVPTLFWRDSILNKKVPFHVLKSQRFEKEKKRAIFPLKKSVKGSLFILENDHTFLLLQMSGGTGSFTLNMDLIMDNI